ncbi:Crp/Fnr family transcriptional regulator [Lutibacter sp.]|uniref:Crp/Fnr family transcriptional regulator n=1 Tax=Lutibacter sp. TaxID=1925666 RepID=UPI0025B87337|nr:Crp/Fnr family transcriptional regulator [Lutibacter sp.]MCF6181901.1 Crp/Fnr family transcriptional regulator [Lutibacter sp.]
MKLDEIINQNFSNQFEKKLLNEISSNGILKNIEPDKILVEVRREINFIPIIISGIVKVKRRDGKGNGIFIHYLSKNQTSAIALTYALESKISEIRLEAMTEVTYVAIPTKIANAWFSKYESWRKFYTTLNQKQTSYLINEINSLAFTKVEDRVIKFLKYTSQVTQNNLIEMKHFDIARDLKVSREAISRTLKKLENQGVVQLNRNKIMLNF